MTIENFNPTKWADSILLNFNDAHVYVARCNRDYEGEISDSGDTVKINSIGRVNTFSVTKATDITAAQDLEGAQQSLIIDQQIGFHFYIEDIDKVQNKPKLMGEATREAGWALADAADVAVANAMRDGVDGVASGAGNGNWLTNRTIGTVGGASDAYETLVDLRTELNKDNVPTMGRWVVISPEYEGFLLKDPRFVSFGTGQSNAVLKNGTIGRAAGFDILISNNTPTAASGSGMTYAIIAGGRSACTFADQIPPGKTEAYRPQLRFSDALKGLHLYGFRVTRPYALARVDVAFA